VTTLVGRRSDGPQSPAYLTSPFGPSITSKELWRRARQQLSRYEALRRRNAMKVEAAETQVQSRSSATWSPSSIPYEGYKALS